MREVPESVIHGFCIEGAFLDIKPLLIGHINRTYLSHWDLNGRRVRFIHQRINHLVFRDVPSLMENIRLVTEHIERRIRESAVCSEDCTLHIIPAHGGAPYLRDEEGNYWRTYDFIEETDNFGLCTGPEQAREAARACARFQLYLLDLPPERLRASIPGFQNVPARIAALKEASRRAATSRLEQAREALAFALQREKQACRLEEALGSGAVPLRPVHGDLKINNILFSRRTGRGICLLDLDTCMPGTVIYDFGDFVRSAGVPSAEDEQDFSKVYLDEEIFRELAGGYLEVLGPHLTSGELELLAFGPRLLALSLGVRFLTDYLNGDTYFAVKRPAHNLERARTQFRILESMEEKADFMQETVNSHVST